MQAHTNAAKETPHTASPQRVWQHLCQEGEQVIQDEPLLASFVHAFVLKHDNLPSSLSFMAANKLSDGVLPMITLYELFLDAYEQAPAIADAAAYDITAVYERDPAINQTLTILLYLKGYHAIQIHRVANTLWQQNRKNLALYIQSRSSAVFGVDIHPAARIGQGVMFDHATGIVIGETAVIGDDVSILQGVTLGGTGKDCGDRHPKVRSGVLIGCGAQILGNIEIGANAKVGAGSVVLQDVPANATVVGVPAIKVGQNKTQHPSQDMNQNVLEGVDLSQFIHFGHGI
ncbi:serine O-acetyltransferase [Ostreibacterium oceani]|uniref:Serine acetyltransferase n=1 Tax=Ostreibacterium oceani TaxID=2654998 RepID=A0A6N7EVC1_9GAMM|nr:serine O-acetyltransferase [Ostreibacterium oceani]MPV86714.1 serine O-acetyltransferase [Ostreibacterium oceani]